MRRTTLLIGLCLFAAAAVVAYQSIMQAAPQSPHADTQDVAALVGVGALGHVEPASSIRRLASPGGLSMNRVDRLLVREGVRVASGELLAEFADAPAKDAAALQAEAAVAEAQANLDRVTAAGRPSEIEAWRARVAGLTAQEDIAKRDASRATELVPSGAGARAVAEREQAAAQRAAAELREAAARLISLVQPRPEDVAVAEAALRTAIAALATARADAGLARVFAPVGGIVLAIHARPGDLVGAEGLLDLADLDQLDVVADVYETDLPRVRLGAKAEVIVPGDANRYAATVRRLGWLVRRTTKASVDPVAAVDARTAEVRLALGPDGCAALRRRINMQVQVAIQP